MVTSSRRAAPNPTPNSLHEASVNGRGIALMRALCDDIAYARLEGCNRLTLTRRLS